MIDTCTLYYRKSTRHNWLMIGHCQNEHDLTRQYLAALRDAPAWLFGTLPGFENPVELPPAAKLDTVNVTLPAPTTVPAIPRCAACVSIHGYDEALPAAVGCASVLMPGNMIYLCNEHAATRGYKIIVNITKVEK